MQPQFNEGIVVLENRRFVNSESGTPDFLLGKSGVRVSSAPHLDLAIEEVEACQVNEKRDRKYIGCLKE